jgi:hypothetical protein
MHMPERRERLLTPTVAQFIAANEADLTLFDEQVAQLLDETSTFEDKQAAEELVEEDLLRQNPQDRLEHGLITYMPPYSDKGPMIALSTSNKQLYQLFNAAASKALREYHGFHQIGSYQDSGYTAWELYRNELPSAYMLVKQVFKAFVLASQTQ